LISARSHFTDDEKEHKWVRVVALAGVPGVSSKREESGPTPVQSPLTLYSTILSLSTSLLHPFAAGSSRGYIHVIQTSGCNPKAANGSSVKISGGDGVEHVLREGDGAYISSATGKELEVENAEIVTRKCSCSIWNKGSAIIMA
jgi:quercetin 2,3-dioxygenase